MAHKKILNFTNQNTMRYHFASIWMVTIKKTRKQKQQVLARMWRHWGPHHAGDVNRSAAVGTCEGPQKLKHYE